MTYTGPNLEDLQDGLAETTMAALGESVRYMPEGRDFIPLRGMVDYGEAERDIQTGKLIEQAITVKLLKSQVPVKPNGQCRVRLKRIPETVFRPVNVRSDRSGTDWEFEVAATSD